MLKLEPHIAFSCLLTMSLINQKVVYKELYFIIFSFTACFGFFCSYCRNEFDSFWSWLYFKILFFPYKFT